MPMEKHRQNGDYVNHYYHTPGSDTIGLVQTLGREEVNEDYLTYDSAEEAQTVFDQL